MIYVPEPITGTSLYIHIPFCANRCPFCHFFHTVPGEGDPERYIEALSREAGSVLSRRSGPVRTIYVGGGTPSQLDAGLYRRFFRSLDQVSDTGRVIERTIEADSRATDAELHHLAAAGFTRVSIGVKSFVPGTRELLGLTDGDDQVTGIVQRARGSGFTSVGIDLVYAVDGQTLADLHADLQKALNERPDHISLYALQGEEGEGPRESDPDVMAHMFRHARRVLVAGGYRQYEICNFALPGLESLHNLNYWCDGDYIGLGPSAHSSTTVSGTRRRSFNPPDLKRYLANPAGVRERSGESADQARAAEALILGLRRTEGVMTGPFAARYGVDPRQLLNPDLRWLRELGLVRTSATNVRLTTRGMLLSNEVFERIL